MIKTAILIPPCNDTARLAYNLAALMPQVTKDIGKRGRYKVALRDIIARACG